MGFIKKTDIPMGEFSWLTVVSPAAEDGVELLLEPMGFDAARVYQKALFDAGIPLTSFGVDDIRAEFERLSKLGVAFKMEPSDMGTVKLAIFEDTCGNLIQMAQQ